MTIGRDDLLQDVAGALGPDERLGVVVVMSDVFVDGSHEFWHAGEHATAQAVLGDVSEEPFDHIEPRRRRWREMYVEVRMLEQPCLHDRMFMGGVVANDQVQCLFLGRLAVDLLEKFQLLGMAVALLALRDDLTVQHAECC